MDKPALKVKLLLETMISAIPLEKPTLGRLCELECWPRASKEGFGCGGVVSSHGKQSLQVVLPVWVFSRTVTKEVMRVQHHDKRKRAYACEKAVAEDQANLKDRSI